MRPGILTGYEPWDRWAAQQGVDERAASRFVGAMFHSLADNCKAQDNGFDHTHARIHTKSMYAYGAGEGAGSSSGS